MDLEPEQPELSLTGTAKELLTQEALSDPTLQGNDGV
jgi:hypothetical protein